MSTKISMEARKRATSSISLSLQLLPQSGAAMPHHMEQTTSKNSLAHDIPKQPDFGHKFDRIQVHPHISQAASVKQSYQPALISPKLYPIGGACHTCPAYIQTKLEISKPGDTYEQEANQIANSLTQSSEPTGTLHATPGEENAIGLSSQPLKSAAQTLPDMESRIHSMKTGGIPLPESVRVAFEPRFDYDFSQVRIHTDSQSEEITRTLNARASTLGQTILFGKGQYTPENKTGQWLMAHELTHVVQQNQRKSSRPSSIVKLGTSIENYAQCAYYTKDELLQYVSFLKQEGKIENKSDSDDKAVAVVQWSESPNHPFYNLDKKIKALLILEMLEGFTGDEEEQAILELLERSDNIELNYILTAGGVSVEELESNFHGNEFLWLKEFFERRFEGGWTAVLNGQLKPKGKQIEKKLPLQAVFPERAEGEAGGEKEVKLRKYIELIDVRFTEVRQISNLVWFFGEEGLKKRFAPLKEKGEYQFDAGTARITYNTGEEETIEVTGGALHPNFKTHRTASKDAVIQSKAGASYVNQYNEPMPYASFFYGGQAFHGCGNRNWFINIFAPAFCLNTPSHGCIRVDNDVIENIYPHIVAGKTRVRIQ